MVGDWAFLGALAVVYLVPGPDMLIVLRTSAASGAARAGAVAFGLALARAVHVSAAVLGLASLSMTAPLAFEALRLIGALYLVWMGVEIARSREIRGVEETVAERVRSFRTSAVQGFLTNITNPKALLFCSVLLPQFVTPEEIDPTRRYLALGATLVGMGVVVDFLFATVGAGLKRSFARYPNANRLQRWVFAVTFIGIGLHLAVSAAV